MCGTEVENDGCFCSACVVEKHGENLSAKQEAEYRDPLSQKRKTRRVKNNAWQQVVREIKLNGWSEDALKKLRDAVAKKAPDQRVCNSEKEGEEDVLIFWGTRCAYDAYKWKFEVCFEQSHRCDAEHALSRRS